MSGFKHLSEWLLRVGGDGDLSVEERRKKVHRAFLIGLVVVFGLYLAGRLWLVTYLDGSMPGLEEHHRAQVFGIVDATGLSMLIGVFQSYLWRLSAVVVQGKARTLSLIAGVLLVLGMVPLGAVLLDLRQEAQVLEVKLQTFTMLSQEFHDRAKSDPTFDYDKAVAMRLMPFIADATHMPKPDWMTNEEAYARHAAERRAKDAEAGGH
jgi:hypothetical protein